MNFRPLRHDCKVAKGVHSPLAVLYKPMVREEQTESGQPVLDENGQTKVTHFGLLRTHFLFNIEQTEGLETFIEALLKTEPTAPVLANSAAKNLLLSSGARIVVHRSVDEAFYHPIRDLIQLPTRTISR